jgi:transcriptional regulator with XRE-family HTH domain
MEIDYLELGKKIARRRTVLNLKQETVAEKTGLSNNYISNVENGRSKPSIATLMKISYALDTTPDYFLLGTFRDTDENTTSSILQRIKLCNNKKLKLLDSFITWIIDEDNIT